VAAARHKSFPRIDLHHPELQQLGLATSAEFHLCVVTFYEREFAWARAGANATGNVITEFTAAPRNRVGITPDYHPLRLLQPFASATPNKKMPGMIK
jgi:hypothetical protein